MRIKRHIQRGFLAAVLSSLVMPVAFASLSLSGTVDEKSKSNKYSLKNFSSYSKKGFSISSYKTNLQFQSGLSLNKNNNNQSANSLMQFGAGNTTYVIPFKYTFKTPKFKTPSPSN